MFKKLDTLVVRAFIGPFIATFFLTLFVLILQFFWLWIDDFVGKDISGIMIAKLILYLSATLVPLALPLAVLLSSIMTFGNLGETFELVAIKSAGIGLLRFMRPLMVVAILLSGLSFLFNNNVMPVANLKLRTLQNDLVNAKPAFNLKEGSFYKDIPGYAIKVGKKEKDDSTLRKVVIYENQGGLQDNFIIAENGIMKMSPNKQFLEFIMRDGWWYQEEGQRADPSTKYIRLGFKEYKKVFDISSLIVGITNDSVYKGRYEMLSLRQLNVYVDSLEKTQRNYFARARNDANTYLTFTKYIDSGWAKKSDSLKKVKTFAELIPDSARSEVLTQSESYANSLKSVMDISAADFDSRRKELRLYLIEWHSKFSMSIAVLVLFLIGAPLGSIVRKGGVGTPIVFAVIFFVIFFLLNNFGRKFVKQDVMMPVVGIWLATMVLVPIGIFLTYKAMHDSQLLNKEFYFRIFRRIKSMFKKPDAGKPSVELSNINE